MAKLPRLPLIAWSSLIVLAAPLSSSLPCTAALSVGYYRRTCPGAEAAVAGAVRWGTANDRRVPAALLRMHFHDCFIRGCDGSVLLNSTGKEAAEKVGPPNISLHAFYVIDNAKKAVEEICPGVVSCADILAMAARDSVVISGGPSWEVPGGRKDGVVSRAGETIQLPSFLAGFDELRQGFARRGLSTEDLVALSGGHTLGFSHCSSFQNRIYGFNAPNGVDPALDRAFAAGLRRECPVRDRPKDAGAGLDDTPAAFDNGYYKQLLRGRSLLSSDVALLSDPEARWLVAEYASSQEAFFGAFRRSMIRMSSIPGEGTEVRLDCRRRRAPSI